LLNHANKQGGFKVNSKIKILTRNAIIAALYVALSLITYPISFLSVQFRLAEVLVLLCFFRRDYVIGITLGCLITNAFSPLWPWDMLFGTLATLISCLAISYVKQLWLACLFPIAVNAFAIGFELWRFMQTEFWISTLYVAIGELIVMFVGYILVWILKRRKHFYELIRANRNIEFKA